VANRSLGRSRDAKDSRAFAVLSQVVGAVILARAVNDREFASRILGSAKTHLLASEDSPPQALCGRYKGDDVLGAAPSA